MNSRRLIIGNAVLNAQREQIRRRQISMFFSDAQGRLGSSARPGSGLWLGRAQTLSYAAELLAYGGRIQQERRIDLGQSSRC